jgi:hypothetical protein
MWGRAPSPAPGPLARLSGATRLRADLEARPTLLFQSLPGVTPKVVLNAAMKALTLL